jgi:phosphopantothenoylcysteine decarboxylase/phosphopantothenate--cysteine ligase
VAFLSEEGARYVTKDALEWSTVHPVVDRLTPASEHLSDAQPFDAYLVAPATYNSLNKIASGIADGPVTATAASALGRLERGQTRVLVVPTLHGTLHNRILTASLARLRELGVILVPPREAYGKHNLPEEGEVVARVCRAVSRSPLAGRRVLVTGGPTPVFIDSVRRITNRFRGTLGALIAEALYLAGADVRLLLGGESHRPPPWLPYERVAGYDEYRQRVLEVLAEGPVLAGVFSAAVADYRPPQVLPGKTPSGGALSHLDLVPTPKVIREVRERFPRLHMVTFKYEEGVGHDELLVIARRRLGEGYQAVVANRGEEMGPEHEQVAYLVTGDAAPLRLASKPEIARALREHLEAVVNAAGG